MSAGPHAEEQARLKQARLNVYFGDLHLHTVLSNDAYALGARRTPDGSYRYAKGEPADAPDGRTVRIDTPLDFLAVTDHAEFLGAMQAVGTPGGEYADTEIGRLLGAQEGDDEDAGGFFSGRRAQAFMAFIRAMRSGNPPPGFAMPERERTVWHSIVEDADAHYEPGTFTTFAAYEWTSSLPRAPGAQGAGNMHRNVIFEGTDDLPDPFSAVDSRHPEDLWTYPRAPAHARRGRPRDPAQPERQRRADVPGHRFLRRAHRRRLRGAPDLERTAGGGDAAERHLGDPPAAVAERRVRGLRAVHRASHHQHQGPGAGQLRARRVSQRDRTRGEGRLQPLPSSASSAPRTSTTASRPWART